MAFTSVTFAAIIALSLLPEASLVETAAAQTRPGPRLASDVPFVFSIQPPATTVNVGQQFTVDILFNSGNQPFYGVEAYLDFDSTKLQVVDTDECNAGFQIQLASVLASNGFTFLNLEAGQGRNDLNPGQVNAPAGTTSNEFSSATQLTLARVTFQAIATSASTAISFHTPGVNDPRTTRAVHCATTPASCYDVNQNFTGTFYPATTSNATVTINTGPSPASTLVGHCQLFGKVSSTVRGTPPSSNPSPNPKMVTELFRQPGVNPPPLTQTGTCSAGVTPGISVFPAGNTTTPVATFCVATDDKGFFTLDLVGVTAGTYDIRVKPGDALSVKRKNITLPQAANTRIDFGELKLGDFNGSDVVNGVDFSFAVPSFNQTSGGANFRIYADANRSGTVNGTDFSAAVPNFNHGAQCWEPPAAIHDCAAGE